MMMRRCEAQGNLGIVVDFGSWRKTSATTKAKEVWIIVPCSKRVSNTTDTSLSKKNIVLDVALEPHWS